ncbi:uncharacterized protein LOC126203886 isoform X1 [Schistocerca nitens]|uniref:uncharacterized protein LOC126203886 isoform X1 n=1 Tax=Schistocerca nitens TaxID=7011 RepID=UPI002119615D|nr:uncharacterized protein LOC126203886 isoform X1 [Schistocerca nitens]
MQVARFVLFVLPLTTLASSRQIAHIGLLRQKSIDSNDLENRGSELVVESGRLKDYGFDATGGLEKTPPGISATNGVQEPILAKTEFVYNEGKDFRRPVSSSDESIGSDEEFQEYKEAERKPLSPPIGRTIFSFATRRLEGDAEKTDDERPSGNNIGVTPGEHEPQREDANSAHKDDNGNVDRPSRKQDGDSSTGGNLVRIRRGVFSVPGIKTIPEVLDMGRGRCRNPHRLGRGQVFCRPVW